MRLIDVNLLIYAFDAFSPQHQVARAWFEGLYESDDLIGIPSMALLGFVRITTNPRAMKVAATAETAFDRLNELIQNPKTKIIEPGPRHWPTFQNVVLSAGVTGSSITHAYLASLAIEHGATLCSADEGFRRYVGLKFENPLRP